MQFCTCSGRGVSMGLIISSQLLSSCWPDIPRKSDCQRPQSLNYTKTWFLFSLNDNRVQRWPSHTIVVIQAFNKTANSHVTLSSYFNSTAACHLSHLSAPVQAAKWRQQSSAMVSVGGSICTKAEQDKGFQVKAKTNPSFWPVNDKENGHKRDSFLSQR